jgi:arylsulfatase A-like enzyme
MAHSPANIVVIYTDQQRADTIAALGNEAIVTPNLDRLAEQGVAFTQATTPAPVCVAARWSLHTGQYSTTHGSWSNHHWAPRPDVHLPGLLREAGYRLAMIGKNHTFLQPGDFDLWDEHPLPDDQAAYDERLAWQQTLRDPLAVRAAFEPAAGGLAGEPQRACTDAAIRWLEREDDRPAFLWLSYLYPHTPYLVPEPYFGMYAGGDLPPPAREPDGLADARKPFRQQFHQANNDALLPMDDEQIMDMRRVYYGMVSLVDAEVGRLLDALDETGQAERTLVVFTSDHGDYLGDHGLLTKSPALYDCLVRVPLIVRWPGRCDAGRRDERLASGVDLMPTILAAAEADVPPGVQGVDLGPFLADGGSGGEIRPVAWSEYGVVGEPWTPERLAREGIAPGDLRNPYTSELPWEGNPVSLAGRIRMARTREWKYVEDPAGTCELYDLAADPHELVNLWDRPEHLDIQRRLQRALHAWRDALPGYDETAPGG